MTENSAVATAFLVVAWILIGIASAVFLVGFFGVLLVSEVAMLLIFAAVGVFTLGIGFLAASKQ